MLGLILLGWGYQVSLGNSWESWKAPASWTPLAIEGGAVQAVFAMGQDSLVAVAWPNLWISVDGGASWQELHYALFGVAHGTVDPRYNTIMLFVEDSILMVSADLGQNWDTTLITPLVSARLSYTPLPLGITYLVGIDTTGDDSLKVYRSTDGGFTWTWQGSVPTTLTKIFEVTFSPARPQLLFLSGATPDSTFLLVSTDGGASWGAVFWALADQVKRYHAAFHPTSQNSFFVASVSADIFGVGSWLRATQDGGGTWTTIDTNIVFNGLWTDDQYLYAGASLPEGLRFFSLSNLADSGWGFQDEAVLGCVNDGANLYLATAGLGVLKGSLGNFSEANAGLYGVWSQSPFALADRGDTLFVLDGTSGRLYRSFDGGATWERLALNMVYDAYEGMPPAFSVELAGSKVWVTGLSFQQNPQALFTLFFSNDLGDNWSTQSFPFAPLGIQVEAVDQDTLYAYGTFFAYQPDGVYKSTDGGVSWTLSLEYPLQLWAGFIPWPHLAAKSAAEVYFVDTQGVRVSTDGGSTWNYLPEFPFPVWRTAPTETQLFASVTDADESTIDSAGLWSWDGGAWQQHLFVPSLRTSFIPPDADAEDANQRRALAWTSFETGPPLAIAAYRDVENDWLYDTLFGLMPTSINIVQDTCLAMGTFGGPWFKACGTYTGTEEVQESGRLRAWVSGRTLWVSAPRKVSLRVGLYDASGRLAGSWELAGSGKLSLTFPELPAGVYHIRLVGEGPTRALRWVNLR